ncbi:MAG: menaquinone biosynthesis decarboxylase [Spirochaetales bacterium]|nr:menaquinone biosynthesis decarboxylase [Spirochaetales bacterium]
MAFTGLQDFIKKLEEKGELVRIRTSVSAELEITEIADRVMKQNGPALLFENVKGSDYPLFINGFGSSERMAIALGSSSPDDVAAEIGDIIDLSGYATLFDKIKAVPRLARLAMVFPVTKSRGACQEIVEECDLSSLPVLKCWPGDSGRFITLPVVITRDPETGMQNMGMYRMQVLDNTSTAMHWHLHKDGRRIYEKYKKIGGKMPVSVAIGCDPAVIYAATAPLPEFVDEALFAGFIRKAPISMVKSLESDILVPASSEFILEGFIDIDEAPVLEGPFGDHTGYYSLADYYPVFHITKLTRKKTPVYPATIVGRPPMEDCYIGKATERIFLPLLKMQCPEIIDIDFPLEGVFHNCVIISIDKKYPGQAFKVMNNVWGLGQMMYTKMIVIVDRNISPHDYSAVTWKVFNNIDWGRDIIISRGPLDALDHSSPYPHFGNRIGIDATVKRPEEGHPRPWPDEIIMDDEIKKIVTSKWNEYGLAADRESTEKE